MLTFTEAQVWAWLAPLWWPFLRMLALLSAMPLLAQRSTPMRVRVGLAALITWCAQASLPAMPELPLDSTPALLMAAQQVLIGLTLGFAARLVFVAVELAGEVVGLQMGLNFAGFFDPATQSQTTAVSRFYGVLVGALFITLNGHLLMIEALVASFQTFPVAPSPLAWMKSLQPQSFGAAVFSMGLWLALPMLAMLMFTNLVLGVIARVAQQMNIFAVGFPITLGVGLVGILLTLPMLATPFQLALEKALAPFQ